MLNDKYYIFSFIFVLLQVSFVLSYNSALYCRDEICPGDDIHIACKRGRGSVRSLHTHCPRHMKRMRMTKALKAQIIQETNNIRDRVAKGTMPGFLPAVRMLTVGWDKELEKLAFLHVTRCEVENDECRNTKNFNHVGQISTVAITVNKTWEAPEFVSYIFKTWINNSIACDSNTMSSFQLTTDTQACRSFAQLSQERSSHIGCAILEGYDDGLTKTYATCNFAHGNVNGQRVYEAGQSAVNCRMGININFRNLCSEKERLDINSND